MEFFDDILRANRAGRAGRKKAELKQLEQKPYQTEKDKRKIRKISGEIERLKELNKIASEKKSRIEINSNSNNKIVTQKNEANLFTYKREVSPKPKKSKKK